MKSIQITTALNRRHAGEKIGGSFRKTDFIFFSLVPGLFLFSILYFSGELLVNYETKIPFSPTCLPPNTWFPIDLDATTNYCSHNPLSSKIDQNNILSINLPYKMLCHLGVNKDCCKTYLIAESLDLAYAVAPIYAHHQKLQEHLYELHTDFLDYMHSFGVPTIVVEGIYPGQNYLVTRPGNEPFEIQLELNDAFYYRENLINVAVRKALPVWEYFFWIDAHQWFENTYWWEEAIYKMEHSTIVQLYSLSSYLREDNETILQNPVAAVYALNYYLKDTSQFFMQQVSGNAWGIRKEIYLQLDYLLDTCIAGGCDVSVAFACNPHKEYIPEWGRKAPYYLLLWPWIDNARSVFRNQASFISGVLLHFPHEHPFDYGKYQIQLVGMFDLERDLYRDENYTLHIRNEEVRAVFAH